MLPSGADAGLGDRADAAGGRRPDHGRDRERVPGARGDHGPAHLPGEADASRRPACRSGCRPPTSRPRRLRSVLHVLYLIFNEGYASSAGSELHRTELSDEAIRLTRMVQRLLPDDGEVAGLLALMLLIDARRPARTDAARRADPAAGTGPDAVGSGAASPKGVALLDRAIGQGDGRRVPAPGRDRRGPRPGAARRRHRLATDPRPVRAAGADDRQPDRHAQPGRRGGHGRRPGRRPGLLDTVDERLAGHYRLDAVRAHLLEMAGDTEAALDALPRGGGSDDEPAGTALPDDEGRTPQDASSEALARARVARRRSAIARSAVLDRDLVHERQDLLGKHWIIELRAAARYEGLGSGPRRNAEAAAGAEIQESPQRGRRGC